MPVELRPVSDNIVCIRRASYLSCSYAVRLARGFVLVDAGMSSDGADVIAGLNHFGARAGDVVAILLTHWHNDHSAGAAVAKKLSGAPVYYHAAEEMYFTGRSGAKGLRGRVSEVIPEWGILVLFKGLLGEAAPCSVDADSLVSDGETILDEFVAVETPGHTLGHVSYYFPREKTLFAGDALAVVGSRLRFMARPVTLDRQRARASLRRCLSLDLERICPGHRQPLVTGVRGECDRMGRYLDSGGKWPFFG